MIGKLLTENSFMLLILMKTVRHVKNVIEKNLRLPVFIDFKTRTTIKLKKLKLFGTCLFGVPIMALS